MEKNKIFKIGALVIFVLILANLIYLDLNLIFKKEQKEETLTPSITVTEKEKTIPINKQEEPMSCSIACLQVIYEATRSGGKPAPTPAARILYPAQIKEFYIPLGSGSTTATSWTDIPGAEAYINPDNYGKIKSLTFEASLRIPSGSGRVYARLYNVNDKLGIFESEVSAEGSSGVRVESSKINLSSNNKLYRVQLKTTMGVEGDLDMGRVKILVE